MTSKYGESALVRELDNLRSAQTGERNNALNRISYVVGQLVGGGEIDRGEAENNLLSVAISIGLSEKEAVATIRSGLSKGEMSPRSGKQQPKKRKQESHKIVTPIPKDISYTWDNLCLDDGRKPSAVFEYRSTNSDLLCLRARYEKYDSDGTPLMKNGKPDKEFRPWTHDGKNFQRVALPDPKPLFNLPSLNEATQKVVIVEGEAKCLALQEILGCEWSVVALHGGSSGATHTDFTPLDGKTVYFWPDFDQSGIEAAINFIDSFKRNPRTALFFIKPPKEIYADTPMPDGGDCKDLIEHGWSKEQTEDYISSQKMDADEFLVYARTEWGTGGRSEIEERKEWLEPIRFEDVDLRKMNPKMLPCLISNFAKSVSEYSQTPFELSAMLALGTVAIAAQSQYRIETNKDHFENLNLYIMAPMPSGERKTSIANMCKAPLREWESQAQSGVRKEIESIKSRRKSMERLIESKRTQMTKIKDDAERDSVIQEIADMESELLEIPAYPRLLTDNCTPEAAGVFLSEHNGCMGILTSENAPIEIMGGLYSDKPNLDVYLKGHCGEQVIIERVGRPVAIINNPRISLIIAPQTYCLVNRNKGTVFRERGMDGRFLYCLPESRVGFRTKNPPTVPEEIAEAFSKKIFSILPRPDSLATPNIKTLVFDSEAQDAWWDFWQDIENGLKPSGELEGIREWASKLPGHMGRIAGIFHLIDREDSDDLTVKLESVLRASYFCRLLVDHAFHAYGVMDSTQQADWAKKIITWIERQGKNRFSFRDVQQGVKSALKNVRNIEAGLSLLEDHYYIKPVTIERKGFGRPAKPDYEVNPLILLGRK